MSSRVKGVNSNYDRSVSISAWLEPERFHSGDYKDMTWKHVCRSTGFVKSNVQSIWKEPKRQQDVFSFQYQVRVQYFGSMFKTMILQTFVMFGKRTNWAEWCTGCIRKINVPCVVLFRMLQSSRMRKFRLPPVTVHRDTFTNKTLNVIMLFFIDHSSGVQVIVKNLKRIVLHTTFLTVPQLISTRYTPSDL